MAQARTLSILSGLVLLYTLPIVLIGIGVIDYEYRYWVLLTVVLVIALACALRRPRLKELGVRFDTLTAALILQVGLVALPVAGLLIWGRASAKFDNTDLPLSFFAFYVLVSAPVQEFLFRAYLHFELVQRTNLPAPLYVATSALLYATLHIIYFDISLALGTLSLGVIWAAIYAWRPNLIAMWVAHGIVGVTALILGFA